MKLLNLPSHPAFWARGLSLCLLALPAAAFGQQGYQVQGGYNPGAVSQTSLLPQSYPQQPYQQLYPQPTAPVANTGLRNAPQPTRIYSPLPSNSHPTTVPQPTTPVYLPATPSTLPTAYAQQGVYPQPQPYPAAAQPDIYRQNPTQMTYVPVAQPSHIITDKDREQDRRITALEKRTTSNHYVPSTPSGTLTKHVVIRGESLWGIAERYGVSESAIKAANHRSSDMVIEGETLLIPGPGSGIGQAGSSVIQASNGTHIVRQGESLSKIAAAYRVSTAALQQANGITNPNLIREGQPLVIPGISGFASRPVVYNKPKTKSKSSSASSKPRQTVVYSDVPAAGQGLGSVSNVSGPRGVTSYRVEAGDNIESVARSFNSTPAEIQRINKLSSQRLPATGEEIIVPLPGSVAM